MLIDECLDDEYALVHKQDIKPIKETILRSKRITAKEADNQR
jgi:hypothetical protein